MNKLYIVITDFNGFTQTRRCLDALSASTYKDFTVLVVDHGTTEETRVELAKAYPWVIRLSGSPSLWWAGANNLGIRFALESGAKLIMLLNNDCYVTPDTIQILLDQSKKNKGAIIAPVQCDWITKRITSVNPISNFLLGFPNLGGVKKIPDRMACNDVIPVKLIIGGRGVVLTSDVFSKVGLFDEIKLPHYGADHDFYLRANKKNIELFVSLRSYVYVDDTRTSLANIVNNNGLGESFRTLTDARSHRNIRDVSMLFKLHYPMPRLFFIGVLLYYTRFFLIYAAKRLSNFKNMHRA